jgi:hypothetical protein
VSSGTYARPRSFALNWVRDAGAESCLTSRELARLIERAVGPVFALPADAELSIEGHVQRREPAGWSARISVSDAQGKLLGTRTLASAEPQCSALNLQIGLVVAMIIDPEIALEDLPEELLSGFAGEGVDPAADLLAELQTDKPAVRAAAPAVVAKVEPPVPAPVPAPSPRRQKPPVLESEWSVQAGLAIGSEFLAYASAGPWVGLGLRFSELWSLALRSVLWLPNDVTLNDSSRTVSFTMSLSSLSGCVTPLRTSGFGWDACVGLSMGVRWSDASALQRVGDEVDWAWGPNLSTQLRFEPMARLALIATLVVDVALRQPRFVYSDPSNVEHTLFTAGRFAPWACLGAAFSF